MPRQRVAQATMLDMIVQETSRELAGKSAHFLAQQIEFRRRDGVPNWDANCDIAAPWLRLGAR
jgi:hypothetical protein